MKALVYVLAVWLGASLTIGSLWVAWVAWHVHRNDLRIAANEERAAALRAEWVRETRRRRLHAEDVHFDQWEREMSS